jgi:Tol biopolymer transport system component
VFSTSRGTTSPTVGATSPLGGGDHLVPGIPDGLRSPDWKRVAYFQELGADHNFETWTIVSNVDGSDKHLIAEGIVSAWSPDSTRIVVASNHLIVANADGTDVHTIATSGASPSWSPRGDRIAYLRDGSVHMVSPTGTGDRKLEGPAASSDSAVVWSRDGTRVAYWRASSTSTSLVVLPLTGKARTFPVRGAEGPIVWMPDGKAILVTTLYALVRIDLATGKERTLLGKKQYSFFLPTIRDPVLSPDGSLIAYSAGGECRDRLGIYVAEPDGSDPRRISNSCRIVGTDGPDVLHASCSQVVLGLGGNDTLYADDPCYYFEGDTLYGGPGDDTLLGGPGNDILYGGPGNDTIEGGPGSDILVGGPGHDHLDGGNGGDTIYAQDGERDWITCGKPAYNRRAVVYADQYDVVSPSCEIVHRRRIG